jgi:hypothetical protein
VKVLSILSIKCLCVKNIEQWIVVDKINSFFLNFWLRYRYKFFFYNRQKNVTFMHRYQVAKYVIFDSEKIFVKKFPWVLKIVIF